MKDGISNSKKTTYQTSVCLSLEVLNYKLAQCSEKEKKIVIKEGMNE